jgi:hypothetical protein
MDYVFIFMHQFRRHENYGYFLFCLFLVYFGRLSLQRKCIYTFSSYLTENTVLADHLSVLHVLRTIPNTQYIASEMDSFR